MCAAEANTPAACLMTHGSNGWGGSGSLCQKVNGNIRNF